MATRDTGRKSGTYLEEAVVLVGNEVFVFVERGRVGHYEFGGRADDLLLVVVENEQEVLVEALLLDPSHWVVALAQTELEVAVVVGCYLD